MIVKRTKTPTRTKTRPRPYPIPYQPPGEPKLREADFWDTPEEAVNDEFLRQLPVEPFTYIDPCYGAGKLVEILTNKLPNSIMTLKGDRFPRDCETTELDARTVSVVGGFAPPSMFITNAPWRRAHLFPIIDNLIMIAPVWTILPAKFMHQRQSHEVMQSCTKIVSAGQINWMRHKGKKGNGYHDYAWFRFERQGHRSPGTEFVPLDKSKRKYIRHYEPEPLKEVTRYRLKDLKQTK